MNKKNRNKEIDAVRGVAMLLVMLGHCIVLNHMQDGILYDAIKSIQMSLFMLVAGYIAGMTGKIESGRKLLRKLGKRAITYLVPFFTWILVLHPNELPGEIGRTLFQLDRGLWFLMTLFLLTVICYVALWVCAVTPLRNVGFWAVWVMAAVLLLCQSRSGNTLLSPHLTIYYMPFYLGAILCYNGSRYVRRKVEDENEKYIKITNVIKKRIVRAIFELAAFVLFLGLIVRFDMVVANNKTELLCQMLASAAGSFFTWMLVREIRNVRLQDGLAWIGRYTLEIYVLHYHFARILGLQNAKLSLYSVRGAACVLVTFIIMSAGTAIAILLLKKFRITNFLLFGKMKEEV